MIISCANCRFFLPDTIGDGSGVGQCATAGDGQEYEVLWRNHHNGRMEHYYGGIALYPNARRKCTAFQRKTEESSNVTT